jgi:uncharacterized DUF497 family protein
MLTFSGFDWDDGNREKCQKHGVSIAEVEALLGSNPRIAPALKHSDEEDRYIAVGRNSEGRPIFVAFMYRMQSTRRLVRPISARYMHKKEAQRYEEKSP